MSDTDTSIPPTEAPAPSVPEAPSLTATDPRVQPANLDGSRAADAGNRAVSLPDAERLQDAPLGWAKSLILTRAGVRFDDPLRAGLDHTHASERGDGVKLIPKDFAWKTAPQTVRDALAELDAAALLADKVTV